MGPGRGLDSDIIGDLKQEYIKTNASELIQLMEQYLIPVAIDGYRKGKLKYTVYNFEWEVNQSQITVNVLIDWDRYMLRTKFRRYNFTSDVCAAVAAAFAKIPMVKAQSTWTAAAHKCGYTISITFGIEALM